MGLVKETLPNLLIHHILPSKLMMCIMQRANNQKFAKVLATHQKLVIENLPKIFLLQTFALYSTIYVYKRFLGYAYVIK